MLLLKHGFFYGYCDQKNQAPDKLFPYSNPKLVGSVRDIDGEEHAVPEVFGRIFQGFSFQQFLTVFQHEVEAVAVIYKEPGLQEFLGDFQFGEIGFTLKKAALSRVIKYRDQWHIGSI
ncbi:hypothetical protein [Mucilaginibacter gossypiicola]|uniref:hypothetical protein n=1 Tax=Mucilaginibacter gossypiicola TaxID=551995 RepID=UPI000B89FD70|nr:hypothetical protein [Mucilaginibacter gossypiicola]